MKESILKVLSSNIVAAGLGFLINIILARLLAPEIYGEIAVILTLSSILYTSFDFGLATNQIVIINESNGRDEKRVNEFFKRWLLFSTILSIVLISTIKYFDVLSLNEKIALVFIFISLMLNRFLLSKYQARGNWKSYSIHNVLNNLLRLLCLSIIVFLYLYESDILIYNSIIYGYIVSSILISMISIKALIKESQTKLETVTYNDSLISYKKILKRMLPLGLSGILIILTMRLDVLFIEYYLNSKDVGLYYAANSIAMIFPLITASILSVFIQQATKRDENFISDIFKYQINKIKYIPFIIAIVYFSSPYIIELLYGESYSEIKNLFIVLTIAYVGGMIFTPVEGFFYAKKANTILMLRLIQLILILIGHSILIRFFGAIGVAYSVLVSRVFGWIYLSVISLKEVRNLNDKKLVDN